MAIDRDVYQRELWFPSPWDRAGPQGCEPDNRGRSGGSGGSAIGGGAVGSTTPLRALW